MRVFNLKYFICLLLFAVGHMATTWAQEENTELKNYQLSFDRVNGAWKKYTDTLNLLFKRKGLQYPPKEVHIRAYKASNELELWARNSEHAEYKLVKRYNICAISGTLGPKSAEGDRQVPEGFYFIDDFNPKSEYYLSMLLSYPNFSDNYRSNSIRKGGDIYIHGGCVTVGCIPMNNDIIQELYVACLTAKIYGQQNIPVHIFPTRLTKNGWAFLVKQYAAYNDYQAFWMTLKPGYDYFEKYHKLLPVLYTLDGKYAN